MSHNAISQATRNTKHPVNTDATSIVELLKNLNTFASMTTETEVKTAAKFTKDDENKVNITKVSTNNVRLFSNMTGIDSAYVNAMKKHSDPDFVVKPRAWGERMDNTAFITHKGDYYLEAMFNSNAETNYYIDGVLSSKDAIKQYLTPASVKTLDKVLDTKIVVRSFKCSSVKAIAVNKELYTNLHT